MTRHKALDKHRSRVERGNQQLVQDKVIKEKFVEKRQSKVFNLQPQTQNQAKYIELLKSKQLVFSLGASGVGKTFVACIHAVNELLKGNVETIVLIRPYEFVGRSVGCGLAQMRKNCFLLCNQ